MSQACSTSGGDATFDDSKVAVVLRGNLGDLHRACERLEAHGIEAAVVSAPGESAAGCCSTNVYLVVSPIDAAAALAVFDSDWRRGLTPDQILALEASASLVVDPDAAETTCPACLTTFATGPVDCPDCGLAIG